MPDGETRLRVEFFKMGKEFSRFDTIGAVFVRTALALWFIVLFFGILSDIRFATETKRSYNGQRHLLHLQFGRHRGKVSFEGEIHEGSLYEVILMVTQGYLLAT